MLRPLMIILLCAGLLGCASARISELEPGMKKDRVEKLLGKPDAKRTHPDWSYTYGYDLLNGAMQVESWRLDFDYEDQLVSWEQIGKQNVNLAPMASMVAQPKPAPPPKQTEWQCLKDCAAFYDYGFCQQKCSY